jgi:SCP-2 sterol transfer family
MPMPVFANSKELIDVFGGFQRQVSQNEVKGVTGSGVVMAYTVHDPAARFVLDSREGASPGRGYAVYIDDPNAPEATVDIFLSADVLDSMYRGELNVMEAAANGKMKSKGDRLAALRLLPVMFRFIPAYKEYRSSYFATREPAAGA